MFCFRSPALLFCLTVGCFSSGTIAQPAAAQTPDASEKPLKTSSQKPPARDPQFALDGSIFRILDSAINPARIAILPVADSDPRRAKAVGRILARILAEGDLEILGATELDFIDKATPADEAVAKVTSQSGADHILIPQIVVVGGEASLEVRLLHVASGRILTISRSELRQSAGNTDGEDGGGSTVTRKTISGGVAILADELVETIERMPGEARYQRVAVLTFEAENEEVQKSGIDSALQGELIRALQRRDFLVVERQRLVAILSEVELGQAAGDVDAPQYGELLDAQALVMGSIVEAGENYVITARVVSTESAEVVGTASTSVAREGAISLASDAIETKSSGEALFRSAVFPGWGQVYNQESVKGTLLGGAAVVAAVSTVALAAGGAGAYIWYRAFVPDFKEMTDPEINDTYRLRENLYNAIFISTGISAAVLVGIWAVGISDAYIVGRSLYDE